MSYCRVCGNQNPPHGIPGFGRLCAPCWQDYSDALQSKAWREELKEA